MRFYIDQTKRRFQLKKKAVEYVKTKPRVDFVFVDVNCSLSIRFKSGQFKYFNSEEELINLVSQILLYFLFFVVHKEKSSVP